MQETDGLYGTDTGTGSAIRHGDVAPVMQTWEWLVVFILMAIPVVNIVMLVLWTVNDNGNPNRQSFARATLIVVAFQVLIVAMFFGMLVGMMGSLSQILSQSGF